MESMIKWGCKAAWAVKMIYGVINYANALDYIRTQDYVVPTFVASDLRLAAIINYVVQEKDE